MKMFHEKSDENIVQDNTNQNQQEIPEKLNPSVKNGSRKNHMAHQHKSSGKTDKKGNNKCCNMGFKRNESKM